MIKTRSLRGSMLGCVSLIAGMSVLLMALSSAPRSSSCSLTSHSRIQRRTRTTPGRASRTTTCAGKDLNPNRPRNWTAPVDYRNGTVHIRAEIIEKPEGGEPTTWTLCYIPNKGQKNGYGCTGTNIFREKGVYERDVSMKSFWENDSIVWSEGIKQMDLVIKDNSGGGGHAHSARITRNSFRRRCASPWSRCRPVRRTIPAWFLTFRLCRKPRVRNQKMARRPPPPRAASTNTTTSALPVTKREIDCCGG